MWREAWKELGMKDENDTTFDIDEFRRMREVLEMRRQDKHSDRREKEDEELDAFITIEEVKREIKRLKKNKAFGEDEIVNELLK